MAYFPPSGSVVAFQSDPTKLEVGASIVGLTPVAVTNTPNVNTAGSVVAFVSGTVPVNAAGSVVAFQGTSPWIIGSVSGTVNVAGNPSISGTVQVGNFPTNQNVAGSVVAFVNGTVPVNAAGSVVAFQGTSPWIETFSNSSILAVPVGSVVTVNQANSIVGTYAEDAASANNDKGVFVLAIRNDTVASLVNADLDYTGMATDSAGRSVIKPFAAEEASFNFVTSVVSGSVTLIKASAIGKKNYITDIWAANTGSVSTLITFQGGDTSIVTYTIAPAGGGSNIPGIAMPPNSNTSQDLAFKVSPSSSILYLTVNGFQAP